MELGVEGTRIAEVKKTHTRALSCKKTFREIHISYPYSPRLASPPLPSVVGFGIISPTLIRLHISRVHKYYFILSKR